MTIASQILSKLDSERLILHVKSRIHQNCGRVFSYFGPDVYALAFLSICSYGPDQSSRIPTLNTSLEESLASLTGPDPIVETTGIIRADLTQFVHIGT